MYNKTKQEQSKNELLDTVYMTISQMQLNG